MAAPDEDRYHAPPPSPPPPPPASNPPPSSPPVTTAPTPGGANRGTVGGLSQSLDAGGISGFLAAHSGGYALRRALKRRVIPAPAAPTAPEVGGGDVESLRWLIRNDRDKLGRIGLNPRTAPKAPPIQGPPKPQTGPWAWLGLPRLGPSNGLGGGVAPGGVPAPGGGSIPTIGPRVVVVPSPATPNADAAGVDSTSPLFSESSTPSLAGGIDPTTGEAVAGADTGGNVWVLIGAVVVLYFLLKGR